MYFESGGARLYYERHGDAGRPVLLLHGWGGKCESFRPVIRDFQSEYRLIAVDFPGHGRSSEPPSPWSVTEYARLIAALMENLGIDNADIIGHSLGGRVGIVLSAERPELVGKLIMTGAAGILPKRGLMFRLKRGTFKLCRTLVDNRPARALFGEAQVERLNERLVQRFGSSDYKLLSREMRKTFNRIIEQDLQPYLPKIKSPTLLIWGENDTETPLWMGKVMEREIPGAQLSVLGGCGHFAYLDKYSDFRILVKRFLSPDGSEASV